MQAVQHYVLTSWLQGHADIAQELLSRGVDVNSRGLHQVSGLVWAAGRGHDDVVRVLLGKDKGRH